MHSTPFSAGGELLHRYGSVLRASWVARAALTPAKREPLERQFLPAALEIIETPAPALAHALTWTIVTIVAVTLAWGWFGQVDLVATAPGKIISADRAKVIQPAETAVVKLSGLAGDDYYEVGVGDFVVEAPGGGNDYVYSAIAWTLAANVEDLVLTGTAAINGTGNAQDNALTGNAGANTLDDGSGADTLAGGAGNDTYLLGRGYGSDTVQENDSIAGNLDTARFLTGVASNQVWFSKASNNLDLEARILGTTDKFLVQNWYQNDAYQVEQFKTTDGNKTLSTTQNAFANLVQAMAGITPGSGATSLAEVTMLQNQRDALNLALNAVPSWQ